MDSSDNTSPHLVTLPPRSSTGAFPELRDLGELQILPHNELLARATASGLRVRADASRRHLVHDLARLALQAGAEVTCTGVLDLSSDHGMLRSPRYNFLAGPDDVALASAEVRRLALQPGQQLKVRLRPPAERERTLTAGEIMEVEGRAVAEWTTPTPFEKLTPLFPNERILLECLAEPMLSTRAIDLIAPLGKGQRALIVAPPRTGKTILLKHIAQAIRHNWPAIHLILLLVDERPEEVTDLRRSIDADIFSSTFDESPLRHTQLSELVSERAKRLVEVGQDVVILLDSITRLARGYNNLQPGKGRIMSGGVDAKALMKPKRFFGAARNVEEGGSLTIVATALVETQSRMDDLIFEEFKGTGNMEIHLDRTIADQRIFPAIHTTKSGTRKEELLYHPDELARVITLRKQLAELPAVEAAEELVRNLQRTKTNAELVLGGLR